MIRRFIDSRTGRMAKGLLNSAVAGSPIKTSPAGVEYAFVHINKTGGTSIANALGETKRHQSASNIIDRCGRERWDELFTFGIVRNPYERVLSLYRFRLRTNQTGLADKGIDFETWMELVFVERDPRMRLGRPLMFAPQADWLRDSSGALCVSFIGRFETLDDSFAEVCSQLKVGSSKLPHMNSTLDSASAHTTRSRAITESCFADDFELFGYGADG